MFTHRASATSGVQSCRGWAPFWTTAASCTELKRTAPCQEVWIWLHTSAAFMVSSHSSVSLPPLSTHLGIWNPSTRTW